jgi:hypothetical protein
MRALDGFSKTPRYLRSFATNSSPVDGVIASDGRRSAAFVAVGEYERTKTRLIAEGEFSIAFESLIR